jgi:hypothetical protein
MDIQIKLSVTKNNISEDYQPACKIFCRLRLCYSFQFLKSKGMINFKERFLPILKTPTRPVA